MISSIPKLDYIPYTDKEKNKLQQCILNEYYSYDNINMTNSEIKKSIQLIIKPKLYIERTKNINRSYTNLFLRIIVIEDDIKGYNYAYTLIHEYIHLDKMIANERLTDYLSVKLLYESDNIFLKKTACYITYLKINNDNGNKYDCTDQLIKYFMKNF